MERRNSNSDESLRQSNNPDVFDDDYEIDPNEEDFMPSTSDGFRRSHTNAEEASRDIRPQHERQPSTTKPNDNDLRRVATRNSTAKVRNSIVQDGRPPLSRGISAQSPLAHRDSVSSTGSFATTSNSENPFETGTGPSHPYGMYPQHTMARPASIATSSTAERQPHRSMSLQRPTHPYAMYSQSGLVDDESTEEPERPPVPQIQTAIPLGFPGLNTGYHRVLGPDGEEQDIIGPDGHTEQLPPYSRYPDEGPTKASMAAEASASRVIPAPAPVDQDDPFMTPVSPVSPLSRLSFSAPALPSSPLLPPVTPARLPPQRPETQTGNVAPISSVSVNTVPAEPSDSSSASLLTRENSFSEKEEPAETKESWRKRKLWGKIPMGVVVVVLILMLIFAVALGAAIGTFVAKKHRGKGNDRNRPHDQPQSQVTGPNGSLFDAIPIPTPPGLAPLPTGAFALPLGLPQEQNPGCLTQANQYSAWSCKLTFAPLVITINTTTGSDGPHQFASVKTGPMLPDNSILYGLQTPQLDTQPMQLVLDLDYKAYGPAYHFASRYDKLVVLRPEELNFSTGKVLAKRQDDKGYRQRFQVRPGENPWFCYWNHTYIEGYVYSSDNSSAAAFTAFPTNWPSQTDSAYPTSPDSAAFGAATAPVTPSASETLPTQSPRAAATPAPAVRRDSPPDPSLFQRIPPYPRIVKIEERRLPDSPQPYCQKMVLLDNGRLTPAPSSSDSPSRIWLQEQDPNYFAQQPSQTASPKGKSRRELALENQKRADPSDACHCQWMFK